MPTLGRSHSRDGKAESKNHCRHHDAHEQIMTGDARLGQCSGMTPERRLVEVRGCGGDVGVFPAVPLDQDIPNPLVS